MADLRKIIDFNTPQSVSTEGRVPPQAVDVEESVIGAMLLEKDAIAKAIETLDDTAFYKPAHQNIYRAMMA
jgi:replicative DNA helicase